MPKGKAVLLLSLLAVGICWSAAGGQNEPIEDKQIKVVDFEEIGYPPLARQTRTEGVVVVRAKLDKEGKVIDADAISGSQLLIPASLANVKKWHFQPNPRAEAVVVYNFRIPYARCGATTTLFTLQSPNFATVVGCAMTIQP